MWAYCSADTGIAHVLVDLVASECPIITLDPGDMLMGTAVLGAELHHPWIKMLLDYYLDVAFEPIPNTLTITRLSLRALENDRIL